MNPNSVIELFLKQGVIDAEQASQLLLQAKNTVLPIDELLIGSGIATQESFCQVLATALGVSSVTLEGFEINLSLRKIISPSLARCYGALPLYLEGSQLTIALTNPFDLEALKDLRFVVGYEVHHVVAPRYQVEQLLVVYSGIKGNRMDEFFESELLNDARVIDPFSSKSEKGFNVTGQISSQQTIQFSEWSREEEAGEEPIIHYVTLLLKQAVTTQASDIHIEPFEKECKIRYRIDGALHEMAPLPANLALPVISRLKMMAHLDIAEQRLPQDGRLQENIEGSEVSFRLSTLPTQFGESLVLRLLDRCVTHLTTLQIPEKTHQELVKILQKPHGLLIVTGPTGSGKTTTLSSCLHYLNGIELKLLTAEDPVEYEVDGIMQVPINKTIGLSFPQILRSFLRQDPDVIMIGETRDSETARIALQASLTGHRVFTTLHTRDAPGAITRLIDMKVEPLMISAALEGVLAQRLVRKICSSCRIAYEPTVSTLVSLGISAYEEEAKKSPIFYYGRGCSKCHHEGYQGRQGIFELLTMNDSLRLMITQRASNTLLRQKAIEQGMITLRSDAFRLLVEGITTVEEVLRWT